MVAFPLDVATGPVLVSVGVVPLLGNGGEIVSSLVEMTIEVMTV